MKECLNCGQEFEGDHFLDDFCEDCLAAEPEDTYLEKCRERNSL